MKLLIDGDTIAYRAAFASQTSRYVLFDIEEGMPVKEFRYKKEALAYLKENESWREITTIEREQVLEPVENALHNTKSLLLNIIDYIKEYFEIDKASIEVCVYLSGSDNFRKSISTFEPYKGSRPDVKPAHLPAIREYLEKHWDAVSVSHVEADDLIAIEASLSEIDSFVIVTNDKDLDQIPGYHFNFPKRHLYQMSVDGADKFLWSQMLTGDVVDNVIGIKGIGPVKAARLVEECSTLQGMQQIVYNEYIKKYGSVEGHKRFSETYRLLRLLRTQEELDIALKEIK
jgi:5'-3' exonuclease